MSAQDFQAALSAAMRDGSEVSITYTNLSGITNRHTVIPLRWENSQVFVAKRNVGGNDLKFRLDRVSSLEIESVNEASTAEIVIPQAKTQVLPKRTDESPDHVAKEEFSVVDTADKWKSLLEYYTRCLELEYVQQFVLDVGKSDWREVQEDEANTAGFLLGRIALSYPSKIDGRTNPILRLVDKTATQIVQLYVGYPTFCTGDQLYPLLLAPVNVTDNGASFQLVADEAEISQAIFNHLGFETEQVSAFIAELQEKLISDVPAPETLRDVLQAIYALLSEYVGHDLTIHSDKALNRDPNLNDDASVYEAMCFFRASGNHITGQLLHELRALRDLDFGSVKTHPVLSPLLLGKLSPSSKANRDNNEPILLSALNARQEEALLRARTTPITVVTGPPGTGKSQLVQNIIADCVLRGESVLLASKNNQAVNVVAERLMNEVKYPGFVRTGNVKNQIEAAGSIINSIALLNEQQPQASVDDLIGDYRDNRTRLKRAQSELDRVRDWNRSLASERQDQETAFRALSEHTAELIRDNLPEYDEGQATAIRSKLEQAQLKLQDVIRSLIAVDDEVAKFAAPDSKLNPLARLIAMYESTHGRFGDGELTWDHHGGLERSISFVDLWRRFITAIDALVILNRSRTALVESETKYRSELDKLPSELKDMSDTASLKDDFSQLKQLHKRLQELKTAGTWDRILTALGRRISLAHINETISQIGSRRVSGFQQLGADVGIDATLAKCDHLIKRLLIEAKEGQALKNCDANLSKAEDRFRELSSTLPESILKDLAHFDELESVDTGSVIKYLNVRAERLHKFENFTRQFSAKLAAMFSIQVDSSPMLHELKKSPAGVVPQLWNPKDISDPTLLSEWIDDWNYIVRYIRASSACKLLESKLAKYPKLETLEAKVSDLQRRTDAYARDVLNAHWFETAKAGDSTYIRGAMIYAESLLEARSTEDTDSRRDSLNTVKAHLSDAMKVFKAWATTSLSARSVFPDLKPELFDVMIIDEASQSDLPSALPLLFRAKRAVIIGDPNQLTHIVTLANDADLALQHGVKQERFSYSDVSLYNFAEQALDPKVEPVMLTEHYRSHPRIIEFSNRSFYESKLLIKTNLSERLLPGFADLTGTGMYWLDVRGTATKLSSGATNDKEITSVITLIKNLTQRNMAEFAGIVTPFRAQKEKIRHALDDVANADAVLVGTAHTFQGAERTVVIFSTVISDGLPPGTINWLARSRNLLNVAVTRARSTLIIVGNHEFCSKQLPVGHPFRQLAEYVTELPGAVVSRLTELPVSRQP